MHIKETHVYLFHRQVIEKIIDHDAKNGMKALKYVDTTNE